jgi:hypothetical protein
MLEIVRILGVARGTYRLFAHSPPCQDLSDCENDPAEGAALNQVT